MELKKQRFQRAQNSYFLEGGKFKDEEIQSFFINLREKVNDNEENLELLKIKGFIDYITILFKYMHKSQNNQLLNVMPYSSENGSNICMNIVKKSGNRNVAEVDDVNIPFSSASPLIDGFLEFAGILLEEEEKAKDVYMNSLTYLKTVSVGTPIKNIVKTSAIVLGEENNTKTFTQDDLIKKLKQECIVDENNKTVWINTREMPKSKFNCNSLINAFFYFLSQEKDNMYESLRRIIAMITFERRNLLARPVPCLYGKSSVGKTMFTTVLKELVGPDGYTIIDKNTIITEDRFADTDLARLLIADDPDGLEKIRKQVFHYIKGKSRNETGAYEAKHKGKFMVPLTCYCVICSNSHPFYIESNILRELKNNNFIWAQEFLTDKWNLRDNEKIKAELDKYNISLSEMLQTMKKGLDNYMLTELLDVYNDLAIKRRKWAQEGKSYRFGCPIPYDSDVISQFSVESADTEQREKVKDFMLSWYNNRLSHPVLKDMWENGIYAPNIIKENPDIRDLLGLNLAGTKLPTILQLQKYIKNKTALEIGQEKTNKIKAGNSKFYPKSCRHFMIPQGAIAMFEDEYRED